MYKGQAWLTLGIWAVLLLFGLDALITGQLSLAFISFATLGLAMAPAYIAKWAEIHVPRGFIAATTVFVGMTLFLGEVYDFYYKYWWWDMVLHFGSAVGFGMIGFVLVFMMFQGDRYSAPPVAISFFGFCFALSVGALWEIFEYGMDQTFGMNMQKSGLPDTMKDLMVDTVGALIGASFGFAYLKKQRLGSLTSAIHDFVKNNPRYFRRFRK